MTPFKDDTRMISLSERDLCSIYNAMADNSEFTPHVIASMEIINSALDKARTSKDCTQTLVTESSGCVFRDLGVPCVKSGWQDIATAPRDGTAIDAVAQSWASMDGRINDYIREANSIACSNQGDDTDTYEGYITEAEELIRRLEKRGFTVSPSPPKPLSYEGEQS